MDLFDYTSSLTTLTQFFSLLEAWDFLAWSKMIKARGWGKEEKN